MQASCDQKKSIFQDNTGVHVYVRGLLDDDAFWPALFQKIAERFYVDKINPSLEYKIWFTPIDTIIFKANIKPSKAPAIKLPF